MPHEPDPAGQPDEQDSEQPAGQPDDQPAGQPDDQPDDPLMAARARVLHDLQATHRADAATVSRLEEALRERRWWLDQWPDGAEFVVGLVAQDVQDALLESTGRWPLCTACDEDDPLHPLYVEPDLGGPDPHWVCEESGSVVAAVGRL